MVHSAGAVAAEGPVGWGPAGRQAGAAPRRRRLCATAGPPGGSPTDVGFDPSHPGREHRMTLRRIDAPGVAGVQPAERPAPPPGAPAAAPGGCGLRPPTPVTRRSLDRDCRKTPAGCLGRGDARRLEPDHAAELLFCGDRPADAPDAGGDPEAGLPRGAPRRRPGLALRAGAEPRRPGGFGGGLQQVLSLAAGGEDPGGAARPRPAPRAVAGLRAQAGLCRSPGFYAEETRFSAEALRNFPQAFTCLALIGATFNPDCALEEAGGWSPRVTAARPPRVRPALPMKRAIHG
jgi:hypothetical protein